MRIELSSGNWVEVRENLKGKDKTAVHNAVKFTIKEGQEQEASASIVDQMHDALLCNIITSWSFDQPIPSDQGGPDAVGDLDIDDYNELHDGTKDLMKKVNFKVPN